jgi:hypothetical protein
VRALVASPSSHSSPLISDAVEALKTKKREAILSDAMFDKTRNAAVAESIRSDADSLARAIVDRQYARRPKMVERFGIAGYEKSVRDAVYNLKFLAESIALGDPKVFSDYVVWLRTVLLTARVPEELLKDHFSCMRDVLSERFPLDVSSLLIESIRRAEESHDAPTASPELKGQP